MEHGAREMSDQIVDMLEAVQRPQVARLQERVIESEAESEQLRRRIRPLLVIESYAQDVVNAWVRLSRCEDEFDAEDGACDEYLQALDSNIILLQRAVAAGREPDVC